MDTKQIILDHIFDGHYCTNCKNYGLCKIKTKYPVCPKWEEKPIFDPSSILRVVRMSYPNSIKGELIKEFAMEKSNDSIFYLNYKYGDEESNKEISLDIKEDDNAVANHLLDWKNKIEDDSKKSILETMLKNQEEFLKKMGDK